MVGISLTTSVHPSFKTPFHLPQLPRIPNVHHMNHPRGIVPGGIQLAECLPRAAPHLPAPQALPSNSSRVEPRRFTPRCGSSPRRPRDPADHFADGAGRRGCVRLRRVVGRARGGSLSPTCGRGRGSSPIRSPAKGKGHGDEEECGSESRSVPHPCFLARHHSPRPRILRQRVKYSPPLTLFGSSGQGVPDGHVPRVYREF